MGRIIDQFGSEVKIKGEKGIIVFRGDECITCYMCESECPEQAIILTDAGIEVGGMYEHKSSLFRLYVEKCTGCGECARVCPTEALTIENFGGGGGLENAGDYSVTMVTVHQIHRNHLLQRTLAKAKRK